MLCVDSTSCVRKQNFSDESRDSVFSDDAEPFSSPLSTHKLVIDMDSCPEDIKKEDSECSMDTLNADVPSSEVAESRTTEVSDYYASSPNDMYAFDDNLLSGPSSPNGDMGNLYDLLLNVTDCEQSCDKTINDEQSELYDDLLSSEHINQQESLKNLQEKHKQILLEHQILSRQLQKATEEVSSVRLKNSVLVKNISSLFQTAKLEIDRKNNEIDSLRQQLDSLIFRRNPSSDIRHGALKQNSNFNVLLKMKSNITAIAKPSQSDSNSASDYQVSNDYKRTGKSTIDDTRVNDTLNADYLRLHGYQGNNKAGVKNSLNYTGCVAKNPEKEQSCKSSMQVISEHEELPNNDKNKAVSVTSQCKSRVCRSNSLQDLERCKEGSGSAEIDNTFSSDTASKRLLLDKPDEVQTRGSRRIVSSRNKERFSKTKSSLCKTNSCKNTTDNKANEKRSENLKVDLFKPDVLSSVPLNKENPRFNDRGIASNSCDISERFKDGKMSLVTRTSGLFVKTTCTSKRSTSGGSDITYSQQSDSDYRNVVEDVLLGILHKVDELLGERKSSGKFNKVLNDIEKSSTENNEMRNSNKLSKELPRKRLKSNSVSHNLNKHDVQADPDRTGCRKSPRKHNQHHSSRHNSEEGYASCTNEVLPQKTKHSVAVRSSPRKNHPKPHETQTRQNGRSLADISPKKKILGSPRKILLQSKRSAPASRTSPRKGADSEIVIAKCMSPSAKKRSPKKTPTKAFRSSPRKRPNSSCNEHNERVHRNLFSQHPKASPQKKRARHEPDSKENRKTFTEDFHRGSNQASEKLHKNTPRKKSSSMKLKEKYKRQKASKNVLPHFKKLSSSTSEFHSSSERSKKLENCNIDQESCLKSKSCHEKSCRSPHKSVRTQRGEPAKESMNRFERNLQEGGSKRRIENDKMREHAKHTGVKDHSRSFKRKIEEKIRSSLKQSKDVHKSGEVRTKDPKHIRAKTKENSSAHHAPLSEMCKSEKHLFKHIVPRENILTDSTCINNADKNKKLVCKDIDLEDGEILSD